MTRYFSGNTLASFFRTVSTIEEATTSGTFDSAFVPNSINLGGQQADYIQTYDFAATGTVWAHCDYKFGSSAFSSLYSPILLTNAGANVFRVTGAGTGLCRCQYWTAGAWVNTGPTFALSDSLYRIDIKLALNSEFELYTQGTLRADGAVAGATDLTAARYGPASGSNCYVSQVLLADFDTRDRRYLQATMDGNSATNTGGTGTYTDVSETVLNEATAEIVAVSGNKMGQTWANITVPSGYIIDAVSMAARGRIEGAITDGKLGLRSGGTDFSSAGKTYNTGYEPRGRIDEQDPDGPADWDEASFNALETYIEAA